MEALIKPPCVYDGRVTLAGLVQAVLDANHLTPDQLAKRIGRVGTDPAKWLQGEFTNPLLTSRRAVVKEVTGIDVDCLLVALAKQELAREYPELPIDYTDIYNDRDLVVMELADQVKRYGGSCKLVALQLNLGKAREHLVNIWINDKSHKPTGEPLKQAIRCIYAGFIEGTRDDVVYIYACRSILGADPRELFPTLASNAFHAAVCGLMPLYRTNSPTELAERAKLERHTTQRFMKYTEPDPSSRITLATILLVIGAYIRKLRPELEEAYQTASATYLETELRPEQPITLERPAPAAPPLAPRATEPPPPPKIPEPPPVSPVDAGVLAWIRDGQTRFDDQGDDSTSSRLRRWLNAGEQLFDPAIIAPEAEAVTSVPSEPPPAEVSQEIAFAAGLGSLIDGIEHCLAEESFRRFPKEGLNEEQIRQIMKAIRIVRTVFVAAAGLDERMRLRLMQAIAPELDELWIAIDGTQFPDLMMAWENIRANRQFFRDRRKK